MFLCTWSACWLGYLFSSDNLLGRDTVDISVSYTFFPLCRSRDIKRLDRETDTLVFDIEGDNLRTNVLSGKDDFVDILHDIHRDFGEVDETIDTTLKREEDTKLRDFRHWSSDDVADLVHLSETLPWVRLETLHRETDLLLLDTDDLDFDLITDLREARRITDMSPINLTHVDEPLDPLECHEETIGKNATDRTFDDIVNLELTECACTLLGDCCLLRENNLFAVLIDIDDTDFEWLADEFLEVFQDTFGICTFDAWIVERCEL